MKSKLFNLEESIMLIKTKSTVRKSLAVMGTLLAGIVFISCLSTSEQALALRGGLAAVDVGADVVRGAKEANERAEAEATAQAQKEQRIAEQKAEETKVEEEKVPEIIRKNNLNKCKGKSDTIAI